jgi:hypothetical protein
MGNTLRLSCTVLILLTVASTLAFSDEIAMATQPEGIGPGSPIVPSPVLSSKMDAPMPARTEHRFWDRQNDVLFGTVAASCAADFAVTRSNLQNGGRELNPITRVFSGSTAGLAVNFAGETAGVIGLSYFFHKSGHHKLERLTPLVNFGASAVAVTYGLTHR